MTPHISQFQHMAPDEFQIPNISSSFSTSFYIHDPISVLQNTTFLTHTPDYFSSHPSSLSSTSEEADEQQNDLIIERKRRRMISNRESARRSRIRKQKQLDELLSQVVHIRTDNQSLLEQLNHLVASHERAVEENARLKEETTNIRQKLEEIQIPNISSDMLMLH